MTVMPRRIEISASQFWAEWARCWPWLDVAANYAGALHGERDFIEKIAAGRMHFWTSKNAACLVEIVTFPKRRILRFRMAGGSLKEIIESEPHIIEWAVKNYNCNQVEIFGREGWERALPGYKRKCIVLAKEIGNGR